MENMLRLNIITTSKINKPNAGLYTHTWPNFIKERNATALCDFITTGLCVCHVDLISLS